MEKSTDENDREIEKLHVGLRRFVHDIIPQVMKITGIQINPPTVDVVLIPDSYWQKMRLHIPLTHKFDQEDWSKIKAVAVYIPLSFEDRLRAFTELLRTDPEHKFYDDKLDYNAVIFLHNCKKPAKGEEEQAVVELYAALASACFPLTINASLGCFGVGPITTPLNDPNAAAAMHALTADKTPEQFAKLYGPED
jgi:hypothetical protein